MFVAINYISCQPDYMKRFEELFASRAKAIDRRDGFIRMHVLKPEVDGGPYLVVSYWQNKDSFEGWTKSEEFLEGHRRGFEDIQKARQKGEPAPMKSDFKTYLVIAE